MDTNTGPIRDGINRVGKAPYTSPKILGGDGEPKNLKKKQNFGGLSHTKPSKKTEKRGRCYKLAQYMRKYAKNTRKYAKIHAIYAKICEKHAKICEIHAIYAKIHANMREYTQLCNTRARPGGMRRQHFRGAGAGRKQQMSWPETAEGWPEAADGWPETAEAPPEEPGALSRRQKLKKRPEEQGALSRRRQTS